MIKLESYLQKPLIKFILWFLTGLFIVFYGVFNVKADTYYMNYEYYQQYYDNSGSTVSAVSSSWNESLQSYISGNITTVANSYGAGLSISSPIPLLANHTYSMSIYFDGLSNIALSSKNRISVGTSLSNAASNYANGNYQVTMNYSSVSNNTILRFAFTTSSNGTFIFIPWTTTTTLSQSYVLTQMSIDDLGSGGVSQTDIDNSLNNQTNIINNSIQSSTNSINDNITNVGEDIKDSIKDTFEDCDYVNLYNPSLSYITGSLSQDVGLKYNNLVVGEYYTFSTPYTWTTIHAYNSNGEIINTVGQFEASRSATILITSDTSYVELIFNASTVGGLTSTSGIDFTGVQFEKGSVSTSYVPYGTGECKNKIDSTNDKLDNIDNTLTDSNIDDNNITSSFEDFNNFLEDNSTITQLVTLPITLYTAILNNVNGSCSPFNLGNLYGVNLSLPCVNIGNYLGAELWGMIDIIISGFAVYYISKKMVKIFNNVSSMKEGDVIDD